MNKVTITIPDDLTPQQELLAIAKHLGRALLPPSTRRKMIGEPLGNSYAVKHMDTLITIKREPTEKPIVTHVCGVCKTIFDQRVGKKLYVNYGGKIRTNHYCSNECRQEVLDICGEGRAAIKKVNLCQPIFFAKSAI